MLLSALASKVSNKTGNKLLSLVRDEAHRLQHVVSSMPKMENAIIWILLVPFKASWSFFQNVNLKERQIKLERRDDSKEWNKK
jgi:hypothetical protein